MNEIVNRLQENEKLKIILVSFVTFFLMIVAIMSNSIVSAYQIKDGDNVYTYTKYIEYKVDNSYANTYRVYHIYYSGDITLDKQYYKNGSGFLIIKDKDDKYFDVNSKQIYQWSEAYYKSNDSIYDKKTYSWGGNVDIYLNHGPNNSKAYDIKTNDSYVIDFINNIDKDYSPELSTPPTPTVTGEQVEGIPQAIIKVMKMIIPVGLVIFGVILGIYLIKRLVAYFL